MHNIKGSGKLGIVYIIKTSFPDRLGTLGNSLNVGLRAAYLSMRTAGGTSDRCRHFLKVRRIYGLTYLLTLAKLLYDA